ncbi:phosphate ABC transporter permease PstA [Desulfoprunum benzoelyticum]|nr:phosphate ABC transporter permease PstA [Desulfoprunum benzoelyticum]MBM9530324.1 phosphate ABC transporter permease PstA [Desulfoprunum benzoelyticum]
MNNNAQPPVCCDTPGRSLSERIGRDLPRRYRAEKRFRRLGLTAIVVALSFLVFLFGSIIGSGYSAFRQTYVELAVTFDESAFTSENLAAADFPGLVKQSLRTMFPEVEGRAALKNLYRIVSPSAAYTLQDMVAENPKLIGTTQRIWVLADDDVDMLIKGQISGAGEEANRRLKDDQLAWITTLRDQGRIETRFNTTFFTAGDSREPEQAGIRGAVMGSFYSLLITLLLSFPIGVMAAIYLEEFAPDNILTNVIEVNINNLAAVPSIIFGLLGLAIFINFFGMPRSTPVVGGLVLTLMTLPVIIIASRAALKSVPPSIREAALGIGASKMQTVIHHVLPLALPGMLTGTIIGMARALGDTAPLLMIGMIAFIVDIPSGFTDPATALPVQIFLWADSPERAFTEKTSAAIMILLAFLIAMNATAVFLRKKFEIKW